MSAYEDFRSQLRVSKHALDDALEIQADVYERIGQHVAAAASAEMRAKDELARVEARLTLRAKDGSEKVTVDAAKAKVLIDPARVRAFEALVEAREEHELWVDLKEAWRQRGFSMTNLGGLYSSSYFQVTSAGRASGERGYEQRRASMSEARMSRGDRAAEVAVRSAQEAGATPRGGPPEPPRQSRRRAE